MQTRAQERARTRAAEVRTEAGLRWARENDGRWNKTWVVIEGCTECQPLDGETVPVGRLFSNRLQGPPQHPNCRCGLDIEPRR